MGTCDYERGQRGRLEGSEGWRSAGLAWNLKTWTRLPVLPASMMTAYLNPPSAPPAPEVSLSGVKLSGPDRGMMRTTASTSSSCVDQTDQRCQTWT